MLASAPKKSKPFWLCTNFGILPHYSVRILFPRQSYSPILKKETLQNSTDIIFTWESLNASHQLWNEWILCKKRKSSLLQIQELLYVPTWRDRLTPTVAELLILMTDVSSHRARSRGGLPFASTSTISSGLHGDRGGGVRLHRRFHRMWMEEDCHVLAPPRRRKHTRGLQGLLRGAGLKYLNLH